MQRKYGVTINAFFRAAKDLTEENLNAETVMGDATVVVSLIPF